VEEKMRRAFLTLLAAGAVVAATVSSPTKAEARCWGCWAGGAFALGVVGGALWANRAYGYYGYPAYYGYYGYPTLTAMRRITAIRITAIATATAIRITDTGIAIRMPATAIMAAIAITVGAITGRRAFTPAGLRIAAGRGITT
jgi:hypothetical protein